MLDGPVEPNEQLDRDTDRNIELSGRGKDGQLMIKQRTFQICGYLLVVASLFMFASRFVLANDLSQLSGTYRVIQKTDIGAQTRVRLQIHLSNHGQDALQIKRLTLWDLPHANKGASEACSIIVRTGGSADTTQEFIVPRSEYQLWGRGARPKLVLQIEAPHARGTTRVVHLDRVPVGKGK